MTSSFETGDDFVAARLSIDIPTEGISTLRELTQEIERYRVGAEAAGRAQDNFVQYLQQTAEAAERAATAQENLISTLQRTAEMQERMALGSATPGGVTVPQGYVDPFAQAMAGRGREGGPTTMADTQSAIEALSQRDPRTFINMAAQNGMIRPGDLPASSPGDHQLQETAQRVAAREQHNSTIRDMASDIIGVGAGEVLAHMKDTGAFGNLAHGVLDRIGGGGGLAQAAYNQMTPGGGSAGSMAMMGARALGRLSKSATAPSGLIRAAAGTGAMLAGGTAAFMGVQQLGETYQQYENMGLVRGGGAAEGIGQEVSIRTMAMNPFLSTEQSRQVIQSALSDGYSGKSFDMVTSFITHNLTEMNMSVAESMNLVRKNVQEGGQSFEGLLTNLGMLKEMSQTGNKSLPQLTAEFGATTANLQRIGMSGPQAERAAIVSSAMFNGEGDQGLKEFGAQAVNAFANPKGMAMMSTMGGVQVPKGIMPSAMPFALSGDQMAEGSQKVISTYARQIHDSSGKPPQNSPAHINNLGRFDYWLKSMGINIDGTVARQYYDAIVYEGRDPFAEGKKKADEASASQVEVKNRSNASRNLGGMVSLGAATGSTILDVGRTIANTVGDLFTDNQDQIGGRWAGLWDRFGSRGGSVAAATSPYKIEALDNVIKTYGAGGFEILDEKGKVVRYDPNDAETYKKLSAGTFKVRPEGSQGPGLSLSQMPQAGGNYKERVAEVQGTLKIEMSPAAQRAGLSAPSAIQLTPHEQQANAAYGGATPNNAPPGQGPLTRGSR